VVEELAVIDAELIIDKAITVVGAYRVDSRA
jgi:hypothetical protein